MATILAFPLRSPRALRATPGPAILDSAGVYQGCEARITKTGDRGWWVAGIRRGTGEFALLKGIVLSYHASDDIEILTDGSAA